MSKRISLGRIDGSGPKISNKRREMLVPVSDLIQEDSCLCHRDIAEILDISSIHGLQNSNWRFRKPVENDKVSSTHLNSIQ